MPYLTVTSNSLLDTASDQLKMLSKAVAESLEKPESYVMINVQHNPDMMLAGKKDPLAYCELKSLGLHPEQTAMLSEKLCSCLHKLFGISTSRIYIEFSSPERCMWGWNNKTF